MWFVCVQTEKIRNMWTKSVSGEMSLNLEEAADGADIPGSSSTTIPSSPFEH